MNNNLCTLHTLRDFCLKTFENKHGPSHDKWFYSARFYNRLVDLFNDTCLFDIEETCLTLWDDKRKKVGVLLSLIDDHVDETVKYIIQKTEREVLRTMYNDLKKTDNAKIRKRFERMCRYLKADRHNIEFLRTFIEYCTRDHLHKEDYADFVAEISAQKKMEGVKCAMSALLEVGLFAAMGFCR